MKLIFLYGCCVCGIDMVTRYFVKRIGMTVVCSGVAVVVVMDMVLEELSCQMPGFYKTSKIPMSLRFNINNNS
jgi:hypothetical protein